MNRIELPALRGDDVTGFLAALGTLRLLTAELDDSARVGWPEGPYNGAVLESQRYSSIGDLAAALSAVAQRMIDNGELLPGVSSWPPIVSSGGDPITQVSFGEGRALSLTVGAAGDGELLLSIVAPDHPVSAEGTTNKGRIGCLPVTPVAACGPGTVHLARTLRDLLPLVSSPDEMASAFSGWRRGDSTGAYLDFRAIRNAAVPSSRHVPSNYGAAAPAWLAMMSTPLITLVPSGRDVARGTGWREPKRFRWPIWTRPMDVPSVRALLTHPMFGGESVGSRIASLSVMAVFEAVRLKEGNNDGAMGPPARIWSGAEA